MTMSHGMVFHFVENLGEGFSRQGLGLKLRDRRGRLAVRELIVKTPFLVVKIETRKDNLGPQSSFHGCLCQIPIQRMILTFGMADLSSTSSSSLKFETSRREISTSEFIFFNDLSPLRVTLVPSSTTDTSEGNSFR